jgi:ribosomal protein S21
VRIPVFDNQIEPALKSLKREMLKDGLFKEISCGPSTRSLP